MAIKVAAIQPDCRAPTRELVEGALRLVREAALKGAHVACLPEHWLLGHQVDMEALIDAFKDAAREAGIYILPGANYVTGPNGTTIEGAIIDPGGHVIGKQLKTHLFGRERDIARPGDELDTFGLGGVKVGMAICHDVVYPEVARVLTLKGADLIFVPSRIPEVGLEPWRTYLMARALENRVPIVNANFLAPPKFPGRSVIIGLEVVGDGVVLQKVLAEAQSEEAALVAEVDLSPIRQAKAERLRSRRPELYGGLLMKG